jgi:hypothetical protein
MKFASIYIILGTFVIVGCNSVISCGVSRSWEVGLTILTYLAAIAMILGIFISFIPKEKPKKKVNYISKITW